MTSRYQQFRFERYDFDYESALLSLHYSYDGQRKYVEKIQFEKGAKQPNKEVVEALCFYTFIVAGSSYYKSFVAPEIKIMSQDIDYWQADFFNMLYRGGLSQFVFENNLKPSDIAKFEGSEHSSSHPSEYDGAGVLMMQSGGRDSLLAAEMIKQSDNKFKSWHMSSTGKYPPVLDELGSDVIVNKREISLVELKQDWENGGLNGHVPFSAIYAGFALIQAALLNLNLVIAANESSSDQANVVVDGFEINHQFSKTFAVEQSIEEYLRRYVSEDIHYGSILRPFNELQIARLFADNGWSKYRHSYSSCNVANYKQGMDDGKLTWDASCAKCANTFVVMAPFVEKGELLDLFDGKNLLQDESLTETYRELFGLSDQKPFECVGTFEELQQAYFLATEKDSDFRNSELEPKEIKQDFDNLGPYQSFFDEFIDYNKYI
jgi:hypothetical protein